MAKMTLAALRKNRNLTQAQAAERLGITISTLQRYELGKGFPTVPIIDSIERLYGCSYADINFYPQNTF